MIRYCWILVIVDDCWFLTNNPWYCAISAHVKPWYHWYANWENWHQSQLCLHYFHADLFVIIYSCCYRLFLVILVKFGVFVNFFTLPHSSVILYCCFHCLWGWESPNLHQLEHQFANVCTHHQNLVLRSLSHFQIKSWNLHYQICPQGVSSIHFDHHLMAVLLASLFS